jgi:hypothetical protein
MNSGAGAARLMAFMAEMPEEHATGHTRSDRRDGGKALRATLAHRFHELVGEPPMTFLTAWRVSPKRHRAAVME